MKLETLKTFKLKKLILPIVIVLCLIIVVTTFTSKSKYVYVDSITIMEGTVDYKPYPYKIIAQYKQKDNCEDKTNDNCYEQIANDIVLSDYELNQDRTYCYVDYEEIQIKNKITTDTSGTLNYSQLPMRSKCYLYFDTVDKAGINIIAKLGNDTINFPTKGSGKHPTSVVCDNEATAKFDYNNWEVEVDALEDTEVSCTVTFEEFTPQPFNTYLTSKKCSKTSENLTDEEAKDCLVEENGLRYEGSNPNNYVLFNDELWRVIGVFSVSTQTNGTQNLVKLIKADFLDTLIWDLSRYRPDANAWENALLQKSLNSGYLNANDEECYITSVVKKTCKFSETGIKNDAREKIETIKWNLGEWSGSESVGGAYSSEISSKTAKYYKVGLMSVSDYGYSVLASNCTRTTMLSSYSKLTCSGQNWLKSAAPESTLTMSSGQMYGYINGVWMDGDVENSEFNSSLEFRPSVYLKSRGRIVGGVGTHDNPYILE